MNFRLGLWRFIRSHIVETWVVTSYIVVSVLALASPPVYHPDGETQINYTLLLIRHWNYPAISGYVLVIALIIGVPLILAHSDTRMRIHLLFLPSLWLVLSLSRFSTNSTILTHVETVHFEGQTYHLVFSELVGEFGDKTLFLYECPAHTDACRGLVVIPSNRDTLAYPRLIVDESLSELNVRANGEIVFRLSKGELMPSTPDF